MAIIAITQLMVALFLIDGNTLGGLIMDYKLHLLIMSTLFIASAGYLINDYYDIKIDYINKPNRVIIGKHIKRRQVLIIHSILNFSGIILGFFVSWWVLGINIVAAFLLWIYSNLLKRLPLWGNLVVSFLTGLSVYIVYFLYYNNLQLILMYAVFAFFISLIREIVKDLEDIEGDESFGCKTLPIAIGTAATKKIIYVITVIFLGVVFIVIKDWSIFLPFFIILSIILGFLCIKIYKADKKNDFSKISGLAKLIMLVGILSMVLIKTPL